MDTLIRWCFRGFALAALGCGAGAFAQAPPAQANEATVKSAFLYKFAGYVEWPASNPPGPPDAPFVIAVSGADEVAAELEKLLPGRAINGRPAVVRRIREGEGPRGAQVVFVGRGDPSPRATIRAAQQQGALVVTDSEHGLEWGGAINFVRVEDRLGFEVSLESAEKSGLRISARMLAVARKVVKGS